VEGDLVTVGAQVLMALVSCGPLVLKSLPAPQRAPHQSALGEVLELMAYQRSQVEILTSVPILGLETASVVAKWPSEGGRYGHAGPEVGCGDPLEL